jgi:hypothetical protein
MKQQLSPGLILFASAVLILEIFCTSAAGGGGRMPPEFRERLDAKWRKVQDPSAEAASGPVVWSYRVSPPFPASWPPDPNRKVNYYVYAVGNNLQRALTDGEQVAVPWALIVVSAEASELELLSDRLKEIGVQGVSPLTRDEAGVYAQADEAEQYLLRLSSLPDDASSEIRMLKRYYCIWISYNGVIVGEIRPRQEAFITWLHCK